MVHAVGTERWWRLTPDANGSYLDGTWSQMPSMPTGYSPTYFASSVLPDGRVIVSGGEYIAGQVAYSNRTLVFDPLTDVWTEVPPPNMPGWDRIGDASAVVLANNKFMLSSAVNDKTVLLDAKSLTWTATGTNKNGSHNEANWTTLPDDTIYSIDCAENINNAEIYDPATGAWSAAATPPVALVDPTSREIGPGVLRADGSVIVFGGNGHNVVYHHATKSYASAPDFPFAANGQFDVADGTAALLPNGNVLVLASPGVFEAPTLAYEWDGVALNTINQPSNAASSTSYQYNTMLLPTGEILVTSQSGTIEIYTPAPGITENAIPVITAVPRPITDADPDPFIPVGPPSFTGVLPAMTLNLGRHYKLLGTQLHGISHGAYYGDDAQSFTNYPLVQFTNTATGHVSYARTYDFSTMSIKPGVASTTKFEIPTTIERGVSKMVVIANGIASPPMVVNLK